MAVATVVVLWGVAALNVPTLTPGHSPTTSVLHPTGLRMASSDVELFDDFQTDRALNTSDWVVNGSAASGVLSAQKAAYLPAMANVTPTLNFSTTWGLSFSGVSADYTYADIQSTVAFYPPFSAQTDVEVNDSHGNSIIFGITSANQTEGVVIAGNMNNSSENPYYGIGVASNGPAGSPWNGGPYLNSSPAYHTWYNLTISVDDAGYAHLVLARNQNGAILGEAAYSIGFGAEYVYLGQYVDAPDEGNGPNVASYPWMYVNSTGTTPAPKIVGVVADPSTVQLGASSEIQAFVSGGVPPLSVRYFGLPPGCPSEDLLTFSCTPTASGSYTFAVNVTDSLGNWSNVSGSLVVTAVPGPAIVAFLASPSTLTLGSSSVLEVYAINGTTPLSYNYSGLPTGCVSHDASSLICKPSEIGHFVVEVTVTDDRGHSVDAQTDVNVSAAPVAGPSYVEVVLAVAFGVVGIVTGAICVIALMWRRKDSGPKQG